MKRLILDTTFLLNLIRQTPAIQNAISANGINDPNNFILLSVVSVAEIRALAKRNNWGEAKMANMEQFIVSTTVISINFMDTDLLDHYVEIDTFSQAQGRKMAKNDLWIAATAASAHATLLTFDKDFEHLDQRIQLLTFPSI
jgi:predicted nucleic acid-binding protein